MRVTVDGHTVDIFRPQFTLFSPQTTVQLPADNVFGVAEQTATITAYGWHANVATCASAGTSSRPRSMWTVRPTRSITSSTSCPRA